MTFVAQPYERFVDDLLIALTGGTIREENEFVGIDEAYAVGSPAIISESMRVFGQRDGTFAVFERGVDYRYDPVEQALFWEVGGRPPDDRTHFYVSYFRSEGEPRLTDRNPGSVTTTIAEAFARQFGVLHKQMEMIYRSAFVGSASGPSLDHIAALLALTRKDAKFATGEVLFKRSTPAPGDITIPSGTVVSTEQGQNFETTDGRTLRRDQLSMVAPIRAQTEGPAGRVAAGQIVTLNRPIFGIESLVNERETFFAAERETDEELRRRIKGSLERAGRSTLEAIRLSLVDDIPQLTEANVSVTERLEVPGAVDVRFGIADGSDPELVRRVEESILRSRPAGVRVRHNLSTATPTPEAQAAAAALPSPNVTVDFRAAGAPEPAVSPVDPGATDAAVLRLQVEVLLRLVERNLAVAERERIFDSVRASVVDYVASVPMGALLVYNKLLGRVVQPDDVADAALLLRLAEPGTEGPQYRVNLDSGGRKLTAAAEDVFVELMEQTVHVDVRILAQVPPPPGGGAPAPAPVTDALKPAVRAAIERALSGRAGPLRRDDIRAAVAEPLSANVPALTFADGDAVVVNAEFEETGRLVADAEELAFAEYETPTLRNLSLDIPGPLDV